MRIQRATVVLCSLAIGLGASACRESDRSTNPLPAATTPLQPAAASPTYVQRFVEGLHTQADVPRMHWRATSAWGAVVRGAPMYLYAGEAFIEPAGGCAGRCEFSNGALYSEYFDGHTDSNAARSLCAHTDRERHGAYKITGGRGTVAFLQRADGERASFDMATCKLIVTTR